MKGERTMNRNLHLIEHKDGATEAEFMTFPAYGTPHYIRRLLTMKEAARAREIIAKSDPYEIDSFCYSIA